MSKTVMKTVEHKKSEVGLHYGVCEFCPMGGVKQLWLEELVEQLEFLACSGRMV